MQFLIILKNFFKSLKSNILMNVLYFLVMPIGFSFFMSSILDMEFRNPIITEVSPIIITDNDNSNSSNNLKYFITSDLKDLFKVETNKDDADLEIVIPDGYEDSLLNNKSISINLNVLSNRASLDVLMKNILDEYHENIYLSKLDSSYNLDNVFSKSSLTTSFIEPFKNQTATEYFAVSMLGFLAINFILNNACVSYLGDSNGLNKRSYSMPIKRTTLLIYEILVLWVYAFLFLVLYILVSRFLNLAFYTNLPSLILLCSITALFIACASSFISIFLPKKIGQMFVSTLLIVQMVAGGVFFPVENDIIIKLSPLYLISDMFKNYTNIASVTFAILMCLGCCLLLFTASFIKEKYTWRKF